MSQSKGWLVISHDGNEIKAAGVAKEVDGGIIAHTLKEQHATEGQIELNGHRVLITTKDNSTYAVYY